jgi:hypothetical protein
VTFTATALAPHELDLVVARGALGPLKGAVLARDVGFLEVIGVLALADTLIRLPPIEESGIILVIFGYANRPIQISPIWTVGVDTIHAHLLPPVEVDIDFAIRDGSYSARVQQMNGQLAAMEEIWMDEGMGIVLGQVAFVDNTGQGELHIPIPDTCPQDVADALQVRVLSSIGGQTTTGWACASGDVWLGRDFSLSPLLLAHEIGHTFALIHQDTGLMSIGPMRTDPRDVRDGETYRAHFHQASALNRIFFSQPLAQHRNCSALHVCLPETLDTREE